MKKNIVTVKEILTLSEIQKQIVREQKKLEKQIPSRTARPSTIQKQRLHIKDLQDKATELSETPVEKAKVARPEKGMLPF